MFKKLWNGVIESAKSGGLGYFLMSVMVVSIRLLVEIAFSKAGVPIFESIAWLVSAVVSIVICVPFLIFFTAYTENKWGWKYVQMSSWKDVLRVFCWTVTGTVFTVACWYVGYIVF